MGGAVLSGGGPGGVDVIGGMAFQLAQALSDVVDLVVDSDGDAVAIEGAADVVDYEVLDRGGRRIAVRQAKTRRERVLWGAGELARILCAWGEVVDATEAEFAFVTDAQLNDSGRRLDELVNAMRAEPDGTRHAAPLHPGRGGVELPDLDVVRRVRILTRMGTTESILGQAAMRILTLLERARLATLEDAENAVNALFRRLFVIGGDVDLNRRTISRADVLAALGLSEADLRSGAPWSQETVAAYRAAVQEDSRPPTEFVPLGVVPVAFCSPLAVLGRAGARWPGRTEPGRSAGGDDGDAGGCDRARKDSGLEVPGWCCGTARAGPGRVPSGWSRGRRCRAGSGTRSRRGWPGR